MNVNNKSNSEIPNRILKLKKELNIKIIEPFRSDIIEFEDIEQFNDYINRDLEKYTALTTQKLNKMFHVPGYRIAKINKEIGLRKVEEHKDHEVENDQLKVMKEMIETLINEVNRIDDALQSLSDDVAKEVNAIKSYIK